MNRDDSFHMLMKTNPEEAWMAVWPSLCPETGAEGYTSPGKLGVILWGLRVCVESV